MFTFKQMRSDLRAHISSLIEKYKNNQNTPSVANWLRSLLFKVENQIGIVYLSELAYLDAFKEGVSDNEVEQLTKDLLHIYRNAA